MFDEIVCDTNGFIGRKIMKKEKTFIQVTVYCFFFSFLYYVKHCLGFMLIFHFFSFFATRIESTMRVIYNIFTKVN